MAENSVFVIAECGSNWRFCPMSCAFECDKMQEHQLGNAYRMIRAAKECGASAAKFQWCSNYKELMKRRKAPDSEEWAYKYVPFPQDWLPLLKAECDRVGIEFMVTCYLPADVAVIAPFVKRFKVAAKEIGDEELFAAIPDGSDVIVSSTKEHTTIAHEHMRLFITILHCVSKYPTPVDEIDLGRLLCNAPTLHGLSDHTAHVLTGAVAVGAGATCIESHVRLHDTPKECPDFPHSLACDFMYCPEPAFPDNTVNLPEQSEYAQYVRNIRTASRML